MWADSDEQIELPIAGSGLNRFTFRTINLFGVTGPEHRVEIVHSPDRTFVRRIFTFAR
jgi:hypothetical protein